MIECLASTNAGLAALAGTLSESQRISLEAHLASCQRCAASQDRLRLFDVVRDAPPPALSREARARVLARLQADAAPAPSLVWTGRSQVWSLAAALAIAAAVVVAIGLSREPVRRIAETDRSGTAVQSPGPRVLAFGSARIEPSADAVVAWDVPTETLTLGAGRVRVSLPEGGRRIRVATDRFVVVALASVFVATPTAVHVEAGWVLIQDVDGRTLARVEAGGDWPVAAEPTRSSCDSCDQQLREAAAKLARRRTVEAREIVQAVLAARPSPGQAAEAGLLLADAARLEGRRDEAVRRYLQIARTGRGPTAQNALYAAAQLEADAGRREASRALLREYLDRFPRGRFAASAAERLGGTR